ncbi:hypothetical protein ONZ45_g9657 [Pleurotus djamor]|nr:hypothetical protein ONZ45_g9657 [Pleurotus djamor]
MIALRPFNDRNANVIIRSSDGVDFYVHESILCLASSTFKHKLSVTTPDVLRNHQITEAEANAKFLRVLIDSTTLDCVLRFCYPGRSPEISDQSDLEKVLHAADQHEFEGVIQALEEEYIRLGEVEKKPLRAYAMARRYEWKKLTKLAVRASLYFTLDELLVQSASQSTQVALRSMSPLDHQMFLQFHALCRSSCAKIYKNFHELDLWKDVMAAQPQRPHKCHGRADMAHFPNWLVFRMVCIGEDVEKGALRRDSVGLYRKRAPNTRFGTGCNACEDPRYLLPLADAFLMLDARIRDKVAVCIDQVEELICF